MRCRVHSLYSLATTCFGHGLTDFGHDQFWAFSRVRKGRGRVGRGNGAKVGGPKGVESQGWRFFFLLPTPLLFFSLGIFSCLFFSLRVSSRVFLALTGCLLVEFRWCFGRSGPPMCLFSPSGCRVEAPGGLQAAGVSQAEGGPAEGCPGLWGPLANDQNRPTLAKLKVVAKVGLAKEGHSWGFSTDDDPKSGSKSNTNNRKSKTVQAEAKKAATTTSRTSSSKLYKQHKQQHKRQKHFWKVKSGRRFAFQRLAT